MNWNVLPLNEPAAEAIGDYADRLTAAVPRPAQRRWLTAYLMGLLTTPGRKTVRAMSRFIPTPAGRHSGDPSQALNNFLADSPWDDRQLLASYRCHVVKKHWTPDCVWVAHDVVLPKRGRRAVGVFRQFTASVGKKTPAQRAVVLSQISPSGCFPLSVRLYLPAGWLRDLTEIELAELPTEFQLPRAKSDLAYDLLREAIAGTDRVPQEVVSTWQDWNPDLAELGLKHQIVASNSEVIARAEACLEGLVQHLGLGDFSGRSWHGWHRHAALVLAAYGFAATTSTK